MKAAGLVLSNIHDRTIPELTAKRTMASLPFGGRYRLIDFTLSNMVNSGITKVGIITHNNYRSLVDHIGTGKDWDLARRSGGIIILPPFITAFDNPRANSLYTTRLEALLGVSEFIANCSEDLIVLTDADLVCSINLDEVIEQHETTGAEVTVVTKNVDISKISGHSEANIVFANDDGLITDFLELSQMMTGYHDVSTNIIVCNKLFLLALINASISHGFTEFYRQALPFCMYNSKYCIYRYDGYCSSVDSVAEYYNANMEMLDEAIRKGLFNPSRPIFTKVHNSPPTRYCNNAKVANSLIADGCVIDGTVENSILFRGCKIKKGTKVKNSILLQNTVIGENSEINCVITDKNVIIGEGRTLSGHETMPFFIAKGKII